MSEPRNTIGKLKPGSGSRIRTGYLKTGEARHRAYVGSEYIGTFETLGEANKAIEKWIAEKAATKL